MKAYDRAAHLRTDAEWQRTAWERALVVVVTEGGRVPVRDEALALVPAAEAPDGERYFLGLDEGGTPLYTVAGVAPEIEDARPLNLREIGHLLSEFDAALMMTAVALVNWHHRHRFSSRTGRPTVMGESGWTRVDGDDIMWPRTDPAVIVLVHDGVSGPGGQCLLGHNAQWSIPGWARRYSCLAGFVEPGESAEDTVLREVAEEVGVVVRDIRYAGSQPWPFPGSLMLGFFALADPDAEITCDPAEISDARWFRRDAVGEVLRGERDDFGLPLNLSIASQLVRRWQAEELS